MCNIDIKYDYGYDASRFFKHAKEVLKCVPILFAQTKNRVQFEACKRCTITRCLEPSKIYSGRGKVTVISYN